MDPEIPTVTKTFNNKQGGTTIWSTLFWILGAIIILMVLIWSIKPNFSKIAADSGPIFQKQVTWSNDTAATFLNSNQLNLKLPNILGSDPQLNFGFSLINHKFIAMLWSGQINGWPVFDLNQIKPDSPNYINLKDDLTKQLLPYILPSTSLNKAKVKLPDQTELVELQLPTNIQLKSKNNSRCSLNSINLITLNAAQITASPFLNSVQNLLNLKLSTLYVDKYVDNSLIFCGYL